jgi:hypothetical protein
MRLLHELRGELAAFLDGPGARCLRAPRGARAPALRVPPAPRDRGDLRRRLPELSRTASRRRRPTPRCSSTASRRAGRRPAASAGRRRPAVEILVDRSPSELKDALACARELLPRGRDTPRLIVVLCPFEAANARRIRRPGARAVRAVRHLSAVVPADADPRAFAGGRVARRCPASCARCRSTCRPRRWRPAPGPRRRTPRCRRSSRAQAQLQAAMLDIGHRRHDAARRRLDALYDAGPGAQEPCVDRAGAERAR